MGTHKIPVGILGATGVVGQRFIQLLEGHPWFEVAWLAASDRSEGKPYGEAVRWRLKTPVPEQIRNMQVSPAAPDGAPRVIFAALDAGIARELEPEFAEAGCAVVSNSSAFRMQQDVPLVIPEVNPDHLALIEQQCWRKNQVDTSSRTPIVRRSDWSSRWLRCMRSSAWNLCSSRLCRRSAEQGIPVWLRSTFL